MRWLTALPVYNEARHIDRVLPEVLRYSPEVLVVDDGSVDATPEKLRTFPGIHVIRHPRNRGYGAALRSAFHWAIGQQYDFLVTIDCDGQHQPQRIPEMLQACLDADIASGSRYLKPFPEDAPPPPERKRINMRMTRLLNRLLGLQLTDAFCGFKAYRVSALALMDLHEDGYGMPLEVWVQAAMLELRIVEVPVPCLYLEEERSFGGALDDARQRWHYYRRVLRESLERARTGQPADCLARRHP